MGSFRVVAQDCPIGVCVFGRCAERGRWPDAKPCVRGSGHEGTHFDGDDTTWYTKTQPEGA